MGRQCHTSAPRGKRIRVVLKDGTTFVDRFLEGTGKFVVFFERKVVRGDIKEFTICRSAIHSTNRTTLR